MSAGTGLVPVAVEKGSRTRRRNLYNLRTRTRTGRLLFLHNESERGAGGRHYDGVEVEGYGNELWVTTNPNSPDTRKLKKSISRSTIELGYKRAREMDGSVPGPKALGSPGAGSYVFILLREFGVIKKTGSVSTAPLLILIDMY